jgi:hypothetical protein
MDNRKMDKELDSCRNRLARKAYHLIIITIFWFSLWSYGPAQELEPGSFTRAPLRLHIFILGYAYSTGNILMDRSLPIEDSRAKLHSISLGYAQVFSLFGQMAMFNVVVPVATGTWRGLVEEEPTSVSRNGLGDPILNFSVNFFGAPALSGRSFLAHREKFILGGSLRMRAPLGQYDETKLINLGTNRWMFRPAFGGSIKLNKWALEANVSSWFFTRNPNFYGGNDLIQKPLYALQLHVIYQFRPGLWIAVSAGRSNGGNLVINDIEQENAQKNSRFGATLALPLSGPHGINLVFTTGVSTRFGADFDTFGIVYKYRWTSGK